MDAEGENHRRQSHSGFTQCVEDNAFHLNGVEGQWRSIGMH
jgi:hypothetical protein